MKLRHLLLAIAFVASPTLALADEASDLQILQNELNSLQLEASPIESAHKTLILGSKGPDVELLRQKLELEPGSIFDKATYTAVVKYQNEHGLEPSGMVGPATWWSLYFNNSSKKRSLGSTIARLEKFTPEERYILVNIPEFKLYVMDHGNIIFESKIIDGKSGTGASGGASPEIDSRIVSMIYNPAWHPTENISKKKLLPKWQKDATYIEKHGLVILDRDTNEKVEGIGPEEFQSGKYKFYQPPGDNNALGHLRFTLIDSQNVYLHDTNEKNLFKHIQRDFSSGCIRVERWLELAVLLSGQTAEQIEAKIATHRTFSDMIPAIPVHLVYWTAVVRDGKIKYLFDLYGRDHAY